MNKILRILKGEITLQELAEYLHHLDTHPNEYLSYFWWKDFYRVRVSSEQKGLSMCELCRRLNDPSTPKQSYNDLTEWWREGSHCNSKPINWAAPQRHWLVQSIQDAANRMMGNDIV